MFNRIALLGVASAALAAAALPAAAGSLDPVVAQPAPAAPVVAVTPVAAPTGADWTGGYVGARLSYGNATVDDDSVDGDVFEDEEFTGALYGLEAGYRYDFGRIVVGGEVSADWTDIGIDPIDVDVDNVLRAGVTAGYDAGRVLPYVTAGYARATFSDEIGAGDSFDDSFDGGYYGLGAAFQATDRITVSAEVLQHRFDIDTAEDVNADVTTFGVKAAYNF